MKHNKTIEAVECFKIIETIEESKIIFELILKKWDLTDKQREEIQSNIDSLNQVLATPVVVQKNIQFCNNYMNGDRGTVLPTCTNCYMPKFMHN